MSPKVWVEDTEFGEDFEVSVNPADLISAVRRGVESGTIKGLVVRDDGSIHCDRCLHVTAIEDPDFDWPVSDGGNET